MFTNWDERGGGWRSCTYVWRPDPPPPPSPPPLVSPRSYVIDGFICCFPFLLSPTPNPTHHSHSPCTTLQKPSARWHHFHKPYHFVYPQWKNTSSAGFFAYNTTSLADVVKTLVCTRFFASGVYEFMLLWTSCIATPFPVYEQMVCSGHVSNL